MIQLFITGFTAAFIGSAIPGVLNMSAAKFAIQYNKNKAFLFILGASLIVGIYCFVALFSTQYITIDKPLLQTLYKIGSVIFLIISIYFLIKGKSEKKQAGTSFNPDRNNFFLTGVFLSLINILPLPYYIILTVIMQHENYYHYNAFNNVIFIGSVILGSLVIFGIYTLLFSNQYSKRLQSILQNANAIISCLSACVMLFSIYKAITI